jgi:hypothetical protein
LSTLAGFVLVIVNHENFVINDKPVNTIGSETAPAEVKKIKNTTD